MPKTATYPLPNLTTPPTKIGSTPLPNLVANPIINHKNNHKNNPKGETAPPKRKKSQTEFPSDLQPTAKQIEKCQSLGFDVVTLFEHFSSHHQAKGSRFVDWSKAFDTWILNQSKFSPKATSKKDPLAVNQAWGQKDVFIPNFKEQEYDEQGKPIFREVW